MDVYWTYSLQIKTLVCRHDVWYGCYCSCCFCSRINSFGMDFSEHYMLIFFCTKPFFYINIISTVWYLSVCVFTKILYCGQSPIRVKVEHCSELWYSNVRGHSPASWLTQPGIRNLELVIHIVICYTCCTLAQLCYCYNPHFLKNVTLSCPTSGMLPRAACHWLTKS